MKILLIQTHLEHVRTMPIGLAYIASYVMRFGHTVKIYDPPPYQRWDVDNCIKDFKPDIVGVGSLTPTYHKACSIAREIKTGFNIPVVFGGVHTTALPKETLMNDFVDFVIMGEGEYTFKELLDELANSKNYKDIKGLGYKERDKLIINQRRELIDNIDDLPEPARQLFPLNWYYQRSMVIRGKWLRLTNLISSRGCPFDCTYCASKIMFDRRVRYRSPNLVVDEIEQLVKKYKLDGVSFSDDTFTLNKKHAIEICKEIRRRNLDMLWRVQMRSDTVDEEVLSELRKSGCIQADLGIESGSMKILKTIRKGITPQDSINAVKLLRKYNMRVCTTFMIGNPGETYEDIELTRELARTLKSDYTQFFVTTPYPGTEMYNDLVKKCPGLIDDLSFDKLKHGGAELTSFVNSDIPNAEILEIRDSLNKEYLTKSVFLYLLQNKYFIFDMFLLMIQKPLIIIKSINIILKTGNPMKVFRLWYDWQNFRRF